MFALGVCRALAQRSVHRFTPPDGRRACSCRSGGFQQPKACQAAMPLPLCPRSCGSGGSRDALALVGAAQAATLLPCNNGTFQHRNHHHPPPTHHTSANPTPNPLPTGSTIAQQSTITFALRATDHPSHDIDPRIRCRQHRYARSIETWKSIAAAHSHRRAFRRSGGSRDGGWN